MSTEAYPATPEEYPATPEEYLAGVARDLQYLPTLSLEMRAHIAEDHAPEMYNALVRVLALADQWQARGDHMAETLKTYPKDVQDALSDTARDFQQQAELVRLNVHAGLQQRKIG